jgi:dethiobiotin synthetase
MRTTPGIFITGTNTGVGKTLVTAAWARALAEQGLRVVALKPIASGAARDASGQLRNADALALQAAASMPLPYERVNPWCFEPAIAPHIAAEEAGVPITVTGLADWYRQASYGADFALVEGAGGWRVPLHPEGFLSDLPEHLGLGVVLVVGLTLGCLNHARLTREAVEHAGHCEFLGWIGNEAEPGFERRESNLKALEKLLGAPPLALIPPLGLRPPPEALAGLLTGEALGQTVTRRLGPRGGAP